MAKPAFLPLKIFLLFLHKSTDVVTLSLDSKCCTFDEGDQNPKMTIKNKWQFYMYEP